ncbi:hypothetical protein OOZ63_18275 [Paucibacter sp. PLA-PC-4]|uniref:hypothetical protein n=1 Tax=Paucibacter sp. PLA-PC-4 TaxID=2993655 RepID=UPI00224AA881|nr:hypothetical protein [Paucibacter sp. PLA-PC-4]MCX2863779.1 hypothetical protein [Paucibacter sp. PLA-PC-4]
MSDEYDGARRDAAGVLRSSINKRLTLTQPMVDYWVSRAYLGVHWCYDGLGTIAPDGFKGEPLPGDPAVPVQLANAQEQKTGGVPASLHIADEVADALP